MMFNLYIYACTPYAVETICIHSVYVYWMLYGLYFPFKSSEVKSLTPCEFKSNDGSIVQMLDKTPKECGVEQEER